MYTCKLYLVHVYDNYIITSVLASYIFAYRAFYSQYTLYNCLWISICVEYLYFSNLLNVEIENYTHLKRYYVTWNMYASFFTACL